MDSGVMGECLLAELLFVAEATNIPAKALSNIHASVKTPLSTNDLQTMSDKKR